MILTKDYVHESRVKLIKHLNPKLDRLVNGLIVLTHLLFKLDYAQLKYANFTLGSYLLSGSGQGFPLRNVVPDQTAQFPPYHTILTMNRNSSWSWHKY